MSELGSFEEFLRTAERAEANRDANYLITNRFRMTLADAGVMFDPDFDMAAGLGIPPEGVNELVAINDNNLRTVTTAKMIVETVQEANPEADMDYVKKELQAQVIIRGDNMAWFELIDREFPGESLNPEDTEFIEVEAFKSDLMGDIAKLALAEYEQAIDGFVQKLGVETVTAGDYAVFKSLSGYIAAIKQSGMPVSASTIEDARSLSWVEGADRGMWNAVIEHFFGVDPVE